MSNEVESPAPKCDHVRPAATRRNWLAQQLDRSETGICRIDPLPPIIVHRPSMRVVDGMHRLRAAMLRGHTAIEVQWFDGEERDVFALAIHTNVAHGLPLSLADRREAAARIIESHPNWSDRMIASILLSVEHQWPTTGTTSQCSTHTPNPPLLLWMNGLPGKKGVR